VRLRLLVVAAFVAMAVVPVWLAWNTGVLPGPSQASAESTGTLTTSSAAVTPLAWPKEPLSLAASDTRIYWMQRDPDPAVAGMWYYDVPAGQVDRLLGRRAAGKDSGFLTAAGDLVVWTAWAGRRGAGTPTVQAYDGLSARRWQVAAAGHSPAAADGIAVWAEPDGMSPGDDAIRGIDSLTDEEYTISADGSVRSLAAFGRQLAWITDGATNEVWAGSFKDTARFRLAGRGTAVAIDHDRVIWATAVGRHSSAIVCWDRSKHHATVLYRLVGTTSQLSLSKRYAAWVTTRKATGPQVWAYDFSSRKAYQVSTSGGRQVSPVILAGSVYWAGDRTGHWELYSRSLEH
jgi:hypothetical protein